MMVDVVLSTLCDLGVYVDKNDTRTPLNVLIKDSITFVSFIVELEKAIDKEIPDEFLQDGMFESLGQLADSLALLVNEKSEI